MTPAQERIDELAALYASGAASASERAELESLAAQDPGARGLMRLYADAAALMAFDLPPMAPPPGVLDAVRRRVVPAGGVGGPGFPGLPPHGHRPPSMSGAGADIVPLASRRRAPVVIAVALPLAAAAAFAIMWLQERQQGSALSDELASVTVERDNERRVRTRVEEEKGQLQRERDQLAGTIATVSTPELRLATVKDPKNPSGVVLKILIDPLTGSWYVLAFQVPQADKDKDYQLWFVDKKKPTEPVPSEVFTPGAAGVLNVVTKVPPGVDPIGAAISLEPKGGSPSGKPTQVLGGGVLL